MGHESCVVDRTDIGGNGAAGQAQRDDGSTALDLLDDGRLWYAEEWREIVASSRKVAGTSALSDLDSGVTRSQQHHTLTCGRIYDYRQIYSSDEPGEEAKENARVWHVYLDEAGDYDMDMITGFQDIIDSLLVFASLFSAVVTTFVAQTSQALQPDNLQIMESLLKPISYLVESQTITSIDGWVNGFFFTSLALSLSTALLSVLAKQWLQAYTAIVSGSAETRALTRHFRFE
ncbi:hypothetical protein C0993_005805 [Termitomyces sp. T159_Od127]|nr:hypothetical protein C0993_005805 [Termitomyces sp. T159_Od127]